jgi:hypothetical protein
MWHLLEPPLGLMLLVLLKRLKRAQPGRCGWCVLYEKEAPSTKISELLKIDEEDEEDDGTRCCG